MNIIRVFTDGSCRNNGKKNAIAGIGVYFGENDIRNISRKIQGKQSNNTAELSAVIEVFHVLQTELDQGYSVYIYSDSEYTIRCSGSYGEKCKKNKWKNNKGYIPNHELVKIIYEYFQKYPNASIHHIKAHTGLPDDLSIGNDNADQLANQAIGKIQPFGGKQRFYLNIPYSEKEKGKQYGAKWDPRKKQWFYEGLSTDENYKILIQYYS